MKTLEDAQKEGVQENTIYNADCLDVMKLMPDKSVDLVLTDLPYGVDYGYDIYDDTEDNLWDLVENVMPDILRVSKCALITCGVVNIHKYPEPKWILNWTTPAGAGSGPWGFTCWQPILAYGKDPYLTNRLGRRPDTIIHNSTNETHHDHVCPKPLEVWRKILSRGSVNEGDTVLDPFLGSGTTAVAAKYLKRKYIGIEISEKYCEIAESRLKQGQLL